MSNKNRISVIVWLVICCTMVFSMVLLGGAVRLTGSGLSMVDWKLIAGVIPPIGEVAWNEMFAKYQQFPEYRLINHQMTLPEFKFIFLMEYAHRILGRLIGIVFFLPFMYFLLTRKLNSELIPRLWLLFFLGAVQGGVGWYMVKSGLVDDPHVSQYRLTLHFMIAVIIYIYMLRVITGLIPSMELMGENGIRAVGKGVLVLVLLMMATGGLVAGTKAGFIFNTYPQMGADWIPDQILSLTPIWKNFFENPVAIQFVHRWLAILVLVFVISYALRLFRIQTAGFSTLLGTALLISVTIQVVLGIFTLLYHVPVALGVLHQAGAMVLVTFMTITVSSTLPRLYRKIE